MNNQQSLNAKIADRSALIGVIGLGYVGLPLIRVFHEARFPCMGFDIDPDKIARLRAGTSYLRHLGDDFLAAMNTSGRFEATDDLSRLDEPDAILICVPTPLTPGNEPDLSYVSRTAERVSGSLRPGQIVVLESTTYPGTTRDLVLPILARSGLVCGRDFFLAFSPEREDPGRRDMTTQQIPKLVGGVDPQSGQLAHALYASAFDRVVPVSSAEIAESAKLLENIFRAVNIAMVNEMKVVLSALGIDPWEVIDAAATKPFGFMPFYPGPGLGGHCIPIDPFYLAWRAGQVGEQTRLIETAGHINHAMPGYVVGRLRQALSDRGVQIAGASVLVLGLAYKPDIDDVRESPSVELIHLLRQAGANVDYNDPLAPETHPMRRHDLRLRSVDLNEQSLARYDCVLVATAHSCYDWQMIADHARLIVDTRNALRGVSGPRNHIVLA